MSDDDIDLPEPEHEHLLDHEFDDPPEDADHDASGLHDEPQDDEEAWDEEDELPEGWDDD